METKVGVKVNCYQHGEFGTIDRAWIFQINDSSKIVLAVFPNYGNGYLLRNVRHRDFMVKGKPYWMHLDDVRNTKKQLTTSNRSL